MPALIDACLQSDPELRLSAKEVFSELWRLSKGESGAPLFSELSVTQLSTRTTESASSDSKSGEPSSASSEPKSREPSSVGRELKSAGPPS